MRRHWQKKPLLVRQAWPGVQPPLSRAGAVRPGRRSEDVESRLVRAPGRRLARAPRPAAAARAAAAVAPGWTLLVQGLDLHVPAARAMLAPSASCPRRGWTT
jgi:50S ribosomal protein L16 3-hydroxylase